MVWATSLTRFNDILARRKNPPVPQTNNIWGGKGSVKTVADFHRKYPRLPKSWCIYAEGNLLIRKNTSMLTARSPRKTGTLIAIGGDR